MLVQDPKLLPEDGGWVVCPTCGEKHKLFPRGKEYVYLCKGEGKILKSGDKVLWTLPKEQ